MRQRLGEDAKLRYNMGRLKFYIPGVSRERARELVLRHIDQDPSPESLRELYEMDLAKPELDIVKVAGMTCVGVPMGTPEFVNAFVRSKAHDIVQDVNKLRIVPDPKIRYDLLRFCQHTRLAFLARNVPLRPHAPCLPRSKRTSTSSRPLPEKSITMPSGSSYLAPSPLPAPQ
jgi:hypothetical protein